MFLRGVAVCSVLALAAVAQGGVAVQLVPNPNQASYSQNQTVQVDVKLAQVGGTVDQLLRMVEFDLQLTNPFLTVVLPTTHDMGTSGTGDDIRFWSFASLSTCVGLPSVCGFLHFIDDKMAAGPVDTREKILSIAYRGLTSSAQYQILLPASGAPVTVGKLQVTMPAADADYTLNLANAVATGADQGARVDFGIDPHTIWRAKLAPPNDVSGGSFTFHVGPVTACTLASAVPADQKSLCKTTKNVFRLTFNPECTLPGVPLGNIRIEELLDNGVFGSNLAGSFTCTIEGNNVLKCKDNANTLGHRKWYGIRNTGSWSGVANFEVQYVVQFGDANNDGRVLFTDLANINARIPTDPAPDDMRQDINSDLRVLFTDMAAANARIPSDTVPKPSGH